MSRGSCEGALEVAADRAVAVVDRAVAVVLVDREVVVDRAMERVAARERADSRRETARSSSRSCDHLSIDSLCCCSATAELSRLT